MGTAPDRDYDETPNAAVGFLETCRTVFILIGGASSLGLIGYLLAFALLSLVKS